LKKIEELIKKYGSTGIQKALNHTVFNVLNYIVVFPVANENTLSDKDGNILPDAILLRKGSTCLDLAYKIHTEIGKNFKMGINVRNKMRVGKEYELNHRDIIKIIA